MKRTGLLLFMVGFAAASSAWSQNGAVRGTGTPGQIPVWTAPNLQGNSVITQKSDGSINVNTRSYIGLYASTDDDSSYGSTALVGQQTATSGGTFGVQGFSASTNGVGVQGNSNGGGLSVAVQGINTGANGGWGVKGSSNSPNAVGVEGFSPAVGVRGQSLICENSGCAPQAGEAGQFITGTGGTLLSDYLNVNNVWTSVFRVDSTGKGFFDGGTQTGGADFAESVAVAKAPRVYEPGDLLVLDVTADRQLKLSTEPYSTLVAGIYSTKPGVLATTHKIDGSHSESEVPLAIVGIVPCKVSAENGFIQRGDLLVTSSMPGFAMRGTDRSRMLGAVIGKAMGSLTSGTGTIEVLVTLQ